MGLNYGSHSTYKYGDAPYSIGVTGALNKIMNMSPYGFTGVAERTMLTKKPILYTQEIYKIPFASNRAPVEMVNVFIVSQFEDISSPNMVSDFVLYRGNNVVLNTALVNRWYELTPKGNILCELHSIPFVNNKEDDLMSVHLELREGDTSEAIVFSSSYLYDNQLLNQLEYVQPFRYKPVIVDNFFLPSMFIADKIHIQSIIHTVNRDWIGTRDEVYVIATLPYGEVLPTGETVTFTINGEIITSQVDYDSILFVKKRNTYPINYVGYSYSGGSGSAKFLSMHKIHSDAFPEPQRLIGDNQYVDNYTVNSIVDIGNNKVYPEYCLRGLSNNSVSLTFNLFGNGNFPLLNSPYDNTNNIYVYGGLSKYTPFSIYFPRA